MASPLQKNITDARRVGIGGSVKFDNIAWSTLRWINYNVLGLVGIGVNIYFSLT